MFVQLFIKMSAQNCTYDKTGHIKIQKISEKMAATFLAFIFIAAMYNLRTFAFTADYIKGTDNAVTFK